MELSECGARYLLSAAYPFSSEALGVCVPVFPSRPSKKVSATKSGIITTNSAWGDGYIAVAPCLSDNSTSIYATDQNFGESKVELVNTAAAYLQYGVGEHVQHGVGHSYGVLTNESTISGASYAGRIVSVGVRVRCISAQDRVGGLMYMVADSQHDNLNYSTSDDLRNHTDCIKMPISTEWNTLSMVAISPNEVAYPDHDARADSGDINMRRVFPFGNNQSITDHNENGAIPIVFWISGEPGAKYEWEVIQHCELVGRSVTHGSLTPSHIDETAFQATQIGLRRSTTQRSSKPSTAAGTSVIQNANYYLNQAGSVARSGSKLITSALSAYGGIKQLASVASPLLLL